MTDAELGGLILAGQNNWAAARWAKRLLVWVLGRHVVVDHLGRRARIGLWRGAPYLLTFREVA